MHVRDDPDPHPQGEAPLEWPGGYVCWPKAFPALLTLATTDIGKSDSEWECRELNVEDLLELGPDLTYYLGRVLYYLDEEI